MTLLRNQLRDFQSLLKVDIQELEEPVCFEDRLDKDDFLSAQPVFVEQPPKWWERDFSKKSIFDEAHYLLLKRAIDLLLTTISAPILLIIIGMCALVLKLESPRGKVFFPQERTGKDGQRFTMFKFRTMVPNAEELKQQYMHLNELEWPDFKITNDPRITKIGRFLRKTSLDELPQIFNVWRGEMSLVGPRPTSFSVDTYDLWHTARLDVVPGLTGLWQVVGRTELEFDDRVRLDYSYIQHRSLWLDFKIMLMTASAVLNGK